MSKFTDYGENKVADFYRGQGITLPANWYIIPASAASDAGITEITGLGIGRAGVVRGLTTWKSSQGDNLASSGTTKSTENTNAVALGTASGSGTVTHLGIGDNSSGGNVWMWVEITPIPFVASQAVSIPAGTIKLQIGRLGGMTYWMANKMLDLLFRAQAFSMPSPLGLSQFTALPTDAGGGTEASYTAYARASLTPSLANISGTQAIGSTTASSGTAGRISNNATVSHPSPLGDASIVGVGVHDALTTGNLMWWRELTSPLPVVNGGAAPYYPPDAWAIVVA
jgi:hypothetical protein